MGVGDEAAELKRRGNELYEQGELVEAAKLYEQAREMRAREMPRVDPTPLAASALDDGRRCASPVEDDVSALEARLGLPSEWRSDGDGSPAAKQFDAHVRSIELMHITDLRKETQAPRYALVPPNTARHRPRRKSRSASPGVRREPFESPRHRAPSPGNSGGGARSAPRSSSPRWGVRSAGSSSPPSPNGSLAGSEASSGNVSRRSSICTTCSTTSCCSSSLRERPTSSPALRASKEASATLRAAAREGTPGPGAYLTFETDKTLRRPIDNAASATFRSSSPQRPVRPGERVDGPVMRRQR